MPAFYRYLLLPFALGVLVWTGLEYRKSVFTVEEFSRADIQYSRSYTLPYSKGSRYLVLANETEEYCLFPADSFVPSGSTLDEVFAKLANAQQATIWFDFQGGQRRIMGVKTATLSIPPEAGLRFHQQQRWALLFINVMVLGLVAALYWIDHARSADKFFAVVATAMIYLGWRPQRLDPTQTARKKHDD